MADARNSLGRALTATGNYDDARRQLRKADDLARDWEPEGTWRRFRPQLLMAFLDIEMDRPEDAKPELLSIIQFQEDPATGGNPRARSHGPSFARHMAMHCCAGSTRRTPGAC